MASKLNDKIWASPEAINQDVRKNLLKIAKDFTEFVKIKRLKIVDVVITGSLANYNWHDKSDIDLHIIYDLTNFDKHRKFMEEYLQTKKSVWMYDHLITIHGFKVEIYPEDHQVIRKNMGVYSLVTNAWLERPELKQVEVDKDLIKKKYQDKVDEVLYIEELSQKPPVDYQKLIKDIEDFVLKLRDWREIGLKKGGEYSPENLVFKLLRNNGYIEKLSELKKKLYDKSLTIKEKKLK